MSQRLFLDQAGRRYTCLDAYTRHLACLEAERDLFFTSSGGDDPSRRWGNMRARKDALLDTLCNWCCQEMTEGLVFKVELYVYGESEMSRRWMSTRMARDSASMAEMLVASMPEGMRAVMDEPARSPLSHGARGGDSRSTTYPPTTRFCH